MYKDDLLKRLAIKDRTFVDKYLDTAGLDNKDNYSDHEVSLLLEIKDRVQDGKESHPTVKQDLLSRRGQHGSTSDDCAAANPNTPPVSPVAPTGDTGLLRAMVDALNEEQKRQFNFAYKFHIQTTPHRLFEFMKEKQASGEYAELMSESLQSFYRSATDAEIRQMYLDSPYIDGDGSDNNHTIDINTPKGFLGSNGAAIDESEEGNSS